MASASLSPLDRITGTSLRIARRSGRASSAHYRHGEIQQNQADGCFGRSERFHSFFAIRSQEHAIAVILERCFGYLSHHLFIVHHQIVLLPVASSLAGRKTLNVLPSPGVL